MFRFRFARGDRSSILCRSVSIDSILAIGLSGYTGDETRQPKDGSGQCLKHSDIQLRAFCFLTDALIILFSVGRSTSERRLM